MRLRDSLIPEYAALVYRGFWFSPEREALQALVDQAQRGVTGEVRLKLFKGAAYVVGRRSERIALSIRRSRPSSATRSTTSRTPRVSSV